MHHSFMQSVIHLTGGIYYQISKIAEDLAVHYVAMTRAQKGVYITSYGKESDFLKP